MGITESDNLELAKDLARQLLFSEKQKLEIENLNDKNFLFLLSDSSTYLLIAMKDPWDTRHLGRSTAKCLLFSTSDFQPADDQLFKTLIRKFHSKSLEYVTWRLGSNEFKIQTLSRKFGFTDIDHIVEFSKAPQARQKDPEIRSSIDADGTSVGILCSKTFDRSRFHNDHLISDSVAAQVYQQWGENCCNRKAADQCFISPNEGPTAGFVSIKKVGFVTDIGLIAVDPRHSGQGIASKLLAAAENWAHETGSDQLTVKTQIVNIPAIRLYLKNNFQVNETYATMRWAPDE